MEWLSRGCKSNILHEYRGKKWGILNSDNGGIHMPKVKAWMEFINHDKETTLR
jgi:hypothetical protein